MAHEFRVRPLPYAYDAPEGVSEQTTRFHHDVIYAGHVAKRNEIEKRLETVDRTAADSDRIEYGALKRRETWNAGGQALHEVYWDVLGGDGRPAGAIVEQIATEFGSFDAWREDFVATAKVAHGWRSLRMIPHAAGSRTSPATRTTRVGSGAPFRSPPSTSSSTLTAATSGPRARGTSRRSSRTWTGGRWTGTSRARRRWRARYRPPLGRSQGGGGSRAPRPAAVLPA